MNPLFDHLQFIIESTPRPAALNMAIDQALLETATTPVLRVYDWDRSSVTVGYSHDLHAVAFDGPVVRRWTGGGIVWHGGDATYALVVPMADPWAQTRPLDSYREIHGALADQLNATGHGPCRLAGDDDRKAGALCFEAPALHDIVSSTGKIAGAGQRRSRAGLLHQGSVKLSLNAAFWRGFANRVAREVAVLDAPSAAAVSRAHELVRTRYATPEWSK